MRSLALAAVTLVAVLAHAPSARAFPGFYASSTGAAPRSESAMVVLMRDGDRTALSIRSGYVGPADDFALVLPVPGAIGPHQVRTLRDDAFDRIDALSAPRLVEFWEHDSCAARAASARAADSGAAEGLNGIREPADIVEARFAVDEYDVVVLRADEPATLGRWLSSHGYQTPRGLDAAIRPYARAGHRFVVVRVDASRLRFEGGRARLRPLRLDYRSDELVVPVRLGRLSARGAQDLVVHVLARDGRYVVANRPNVLVPTNLVMYPAARGRLGAVYATILERVRERHPTAAITEYASPATRCVECPGPPLSDADLDTFGREVLGPVARLADDFVLTRLRVRIDGAPDSDLVLRTAPPVAGGRGRPGREGVLEQRIERRAASNAFAARYAILHPRQRGRSCAARRPARWGSPPRARRPPAIALHPSRVPIVRGQLRRFLQSWAPVLRIPCRGDAPAAS